jgi:hypothetical protein
MSRLLTSNVCVVVCCVDSALAVCSLLLCEVPSRPKSLHTAAGGYGFLILGSFIPPSS